MQDEKVPTGRELKKVIKNSEEGWPFTTKSICAQFVNLIQKECRVHGVYVTYPEKEDLGSLRRNKGFSGGIGRGLMSCLKNGQAGLNFVT